MKKIFFTFLIISLIGPRANAQDFIADSIRSVIDNTKSDSIKASMLINLAKHNWDDLLQYDSAIIILNSSLELATQKKLAKQEIESLSLLGQYYSRAVGKNHDNEKGYQLALLGINLARQYHLKDQEVDLLLSISRLPDIRMDSANLLIEQALNIATQYNLAEQQINALTRKGTFYASAQSDSAKRYYLQALDIARQSNLPKSEASVLQAMALAFSINHWGDSSNYFMTKAISVAKENHLPSVEAGLLSICVDTRRGFFIKDSLIPYYERAISLYRQLHRDSLRLMNSFARSCMDVINYPKALQTYLIVLHNAEEKKDSIDLQITLDQIGGLFQAVKDYKKSIEYFNETIKCGAKMPFFYMFGHVDIALSYSKLKQKDSALHYANKAYQIALDYYHTPDKVFGGVLNTLGEVYLESGEDSIAYDHLRRSYAYFTHSARDYDNFCETTRGLANYFKKFGSPDSSVFYAKICLTTAQANGFLDFIFDASSIISDYYQKKHNADSAYHYQQIGFEAYKTLYSDDASRQFQDMSHAENQREQDIAQAKKIAADKYASNLKLYALITVLIVALIIGLIVFRNNRQRQKAFDLLKKQKQEIDLQKSKLETSLNDLQATQSQLIQSEKMASLGELTAGIAHEIQNPLNFVNNFSEVSNELITEIQEERNKAQGTRDEKMQDEILNDIKQNLEKINHHGKRADAIVKGMLQHSRKSSGQKEPTDINALADEYLRLSYHGIRAKDNSFNATMKTDFDESLGKIDIIPQDIGRVLLNLYNNAFYAVSERRKAEGAGYEPTVSVNTKKEGNKISITVGDNGGGIPQNIVDKIFQPFFTTKPSGQGTGLGLSLSYDVIKTHGGEIKAETKEGEGTTFIIRLPEL